MRSSFGVLLFLFAAVVASAAGAQQRLVLATMENTPNGRIGAAVLTQAYATLGIEVEIYQTSGQRGLMLSSNGTLDGEVVRFAIIGDLHPSLHRVGVPLVPFAVTVFVDSSRISQDMMGNLPNLRVGHLAGAVRLERLTQSFSDVWQATSNKELFEMLAAGHLDAVVSDSVAGRIALNQLGLRGIGEMEPPLVRDNLYHFLHEKHAHLVPKVTRALEAMEQSGELGAVVDAAIDAMTVHEAGDAQMEMN